MVRLFHVNVATKTSLFAAVAIAILMCAPIAQAQGTSVNTTICNADAPSSALLSISAPGHGLVFNSPSIDIKGSINDLAQIQVWVDGQYSHTIPVDANQESLATTINLSVGTHVIQLVGIDVCQIDNPTDEFSVTYEPTAVKPQTPSQTAGVGQSTVSDATTASGSVIDNNESPLMVIPRAIGNITRNVLKSLDILPPSSAQYLPATKTRFALVLVGSTAIIWPELTAIAIHHHWFVWRGRRFAWQLKEIKRVGPRLALRLTGIALIIITLLS